MKLKLFKNHFTGIRKTIIIQSCLLSFFSLTAFANLSPPRNFFHPIYFLPEELHSVSADFDDLGLGGGFELHVNSSDVLPVLKKYLPAKLDLKKPEIFVGVQINKYKDLSVYLAVKSTLFYQYKYGVGAKAYFYYLGKDKYALSLAAFSGMKIKGWPLKRAYLIPYIGFRSVILNNVDNKISIKNVLSSASSLFSNSNLINYGVYFQPDIGQSFSCSVESDGQSWVLSFHFGSPLLGSKKH